MPVKIFRANGADDIDNMEKKINQWLMSFGAGDRMTNHIASMSTAMTTVASEKDKES